MALLAKEVKMKPQTLRAAVLVLVQHNVLWHAEAADGTEVLEINTEECIARLYFGSYIHSAKEAFSSEVCWQS